MYNTNNTHARGKHDDETKLVKERSEGEEKKNSQEETSVQHPHERVQPPLRRVAPDGRPPQHQVQLEPPAGHQGAEEHQDEGDGVVQRLQGGDLGEDLEGRELGQGAGARWSSSPGHRDGTGCWWMWEATGVSCQAGADRARRGKWGWVWVMCPCATRASSLVRSRAWQTKKAEGGSMRMESGRFRPKGSSKLAADSLGLSFGSGPRSCNVV